MRARSPRPPGFSRRIVRCCLGALAVLTALAGPDLRGDIQQPPRATAQGERRLQRRPNGPASALPLDAVVDEGGRTEITLRGVGQAGKNLEFYIRALPQHGVLSDERVRRSHSAVSMEYVQNSGDMATDDQFTFCVQAPGSALSAPETVHVRILPSPPVLVATPFELDFGAVKAGESARAELTLENRGGSEATGQLQPPAPWVVEGPAEYRLPRGGSQTFQLVFKPRGEQVFMDTIHFKFESGGGVRLVGTGLVEPGQPVATSPAATATATVGAAPGGNGSLTISPVVSASPPPTGPGQWDGTGRKAGGPLTVGDLPGRPGGAPSLAVRDETAVLLNEAAVKQVDVRNVGATTAELAWKPPVPKPASYRVELRYISVEDDKVRIDWRPYALVDFQVGRDQVTASLRRLPSTNLQMMRVVAVDAAGRLASPSPMITVPMHLPSTFWHVTPLKVLVFLLVVCGGLLVYKRREDQLILRSIDESRQQSNAEAGVAWRT